MEVKYRFHGTLQQRPWKLSSTSMGVKYTPIKVEFTSMEVVPAAIESASMEYSTNFPTARLPLETLTPQQALPIWHPALTLNAPEQM